MISRLLWVLLASCATGKCECLWWIIIFLNTKLMIRHFNINVGIFYFLNLHKLLNCINVIFMTALMSCMLKWKSITILFAGQYTTKRPIPFSAVDEECDCPTTDSKWMTEIQVIWMLYKNAHNFSCGGGFYHYVT